MIDELEGQARLVIDAKLTPLIGSTFQPTGFADLGAAVFERPGQGPALLVESVQSMTNHFEEVGWDRAAGEPVATLAKLPYVAVRSADQDLLTSSRLEPHRLASAYIADAKVDGTTGVEWISQGLGLRSGHPLGWATIYGSLLEWDPLCLLHGVFFSRKAWHGNPKVRRALSAIIEAHDVAPAVSGGLKRDDVSFTAEKGVRAADEGYGFVPFPRTEYTAREIILTASLDLSQVRGYGLGLDATRLLTLVALWELTAVLTDPLRLRTACDLDVEDVRVRRPKGFELPDHAELAAEIAGSSLAFKNPGARTAIWPAEGKKAKDGHGIGEP